MCPARWSPAAHSAYARCPASRSPPVQKASPSSPDAPARTEVVVLRRPGRAPAGRAARWPARSPRARASAARYSSIPPGRRRNSASSATIIPGPAGADPHRGLPGPASARRLRSRPSTPSSWPPARSAPAHPTLSTGRTRITSSGSARSQPWTVGLLPGPAHGGDGQLDQVGRPPEIPGGQRVPDRRRLLAVALEPGARPPVQFRDLAGLLVQQVRLQHVGEQVVVAVPAAAVVERDHEQVAPVQRLQHGLAAALPGDGVAQRAAQPVQDGGLQQERPDRGRAGAAAPPRRGSRRCSGRLPRSRR